ncbi:hypothetical protein DLM_2502 [Aquitalea magnusonii]|uniref:Uncharacterized protein n=1 Tax=Aquitalea magnusonii TaxID=332411 RepID=A0A3G9GHK0_9NEIS|nr:hypothetical protein DLM_2502 [Aquitalea magnusonii]
MLAQTQAEIVNTLHFDAPQFGWAALSPIPRHKIHFSRVFAHTPGKWC